MCKRARRGIYCAFLTISCVVRPCPSLLAKAKVAALASFSFQPLPSPSEPFRVIVVGDAMHLEESVQTFEQYAHILSCCLREVDLDRSAGPGDSSMPAKYQRQLNLFLPEQALLPW